MPRCWASGFARISLSERLKRCVTSAKPRVTCCDTRSRINGLRVVAGIASATETDDLRAPLPLLRHSITRAFSAIMKLAD